MDQTLGEALKKKEVSLMKRLFCLVLSLLMVLGASTALATEYPLADETANFRLIIRVRPLHGNPDEM